MTCPDCGRKKWVFMETPLEGHCATLELAGLTDCLRIALASERAARQAQRWETGKERGQMNAALKGEMARAEKAEQEAKTWKDWSLTICEAAEAYRHYAAHPAGTESVVAQLRILRRAIRDAALEPEP